MIEDDHPSFNSVKVQLTLSDVSKFKIKEALKFLHGEDFVHKQQSDYNDKNKFGTDRTEDGTDRINLVVQGGQCNTTNSTAEEQIHHFCMKRLLSYGFFKLHCSEALSATNGDVACAYELLMCRYFNLTPPKGDYVPQHLIDERLHESQLLRSIYNQSFVEIIPNTLWVFHLNLPYLGKLYTKEELQECSVIIDKTRNKFHLEVRFPTGCQYPLETPMVSLVAQCSDFPPRSCLSITDRLMQEAQKNMALQQPCISNLLDLLLHRHEDILSMLNGPYPMFYDPAVSLFPEAVPQVQEDGNPEDLMYSGQASKKFEARLQHFEKNDEDLGKRYQSMVNSPSYPPILAKRKQLPAWAKMNEVLELINKNQVVIISGETGCGKSTQVPQFILDEWLSKPNGKHVEIICTQPRRISAIGVAKRVASERLENIGDSIGYQIRLETRCSAVTRLIFCTTGILLRRLESDPNLQDISHVIVDEVHERSVESDFLLLILKELIRKRLELKVILMSASINLSLFQNYFDQCPTIEIPGRTFPVDQIYLENIISRTNYALEEWSKYSRKAGKLMSRQLEEMDSCGDVQKYIKDSKPSVSTNDEHLPIKEFYYRYSDYGKRVCRTLYLNDTERINYDLVLVLIKFIVTHDHEFPKKGSILVFLPGNGEINDMRIRLEADPLFSPRNSDFILIPLHSTLTNEDQSLVFRKSRPGQRKIILSTNIAETSITIDDCVYVIDCGKMKQKGFDSIRNMETLEMVNVSKANALQRKGRAGRVMPGVCFHLFTKHRFENVLPAQPVPEIQRVSLEQLVLRIKALSNFDKDLDQVFNSMIEPPRMENVEGATTRLKNVGALDETGNLTPLGRHLASLPVAVPIGKLLLYGAMFCALDSALTIAAFVSFKSPFITNTGKRDKTDPNKKRFITGHSDHLTTLNAYKEWLKVVNEKGMIAGNKFARENHLSSETLRTLADMKLQYLELLRTIGFVPDDIQITRSRPGVDRILEITGQDLNANGENQNLLVSILCASLYPNIVKIFTPKRIYEEIRYETKLDGFVDLHPSSVNSTVNDYTSPYLVFQEKIKTRKVFVQDCTMVPVLAIILFSPCKVKREVKRDECLISLDNGWLIFPVSSNEVAELLESIKIELQTLLDQKIKEPKLNLQNHPKGEKIISTIVHLVSCSN